MDSNLATFAVEDDSHIVVEEIAPSATGSGTKKERKKERRKKEFIFLMLITKKWHNTQNKK